MARYRLTGPHYLQDRVLEAGAEVGDGTDFPFPGLPTLQMEGLDDEGKTLVNEAIETYGRLADQVFSPPFVQPEDRLGKRVPISAKTPVFPADKK